jgi:purine-binding chemotaxis protein CheW
MSAIRYLCFTLAGEHCALDCAHVREILPLPALGKPPGLPPAIEGVIGLGDRAVPLLRLDRLLGLPDARASAYQHVLLLRQEPALALLVDRVTEIARIGEDRIHALEESDSFNGCVGAEIRTDGPTVHCLVLERLLTRRERGALAAFQAREEARLRDVGGAA